MSLYIMLNVYLIVHFQFKKKSYYLLNESISGYRLVSVVSNEAPFQTNILVIEMTSNTVSLKSSSNIRYRNFLYVSMHNNAFLVHVVLSSDLNFSMYRVAIIVF